MQLNIHEAKTQLSKLVEDVLAGGEVVIAKAGKPLVRLVKLAASDNLATQRTLGCLAGKYSIPADFDAPLDEETLALFYQQD